MESVAQKNYDLTRGFKEYEAKVKNLKGIFKKLDGIVDIERYERELATIQNEAIKDKSINNKMPSNEMQLEYEGMVLAPYIKRIDELTRELENDILPFYELYLFTTKVNMQVDQITEDTISVIIENTLMLINKINDVNTHNSEDKNGIIKQAYETVYRVILNEEMFDRSDVLNYVNRQNIPANRENLGRLLSRDLEKLDKEDLIDSDLESKREEKLGNDYLSQRVIRNLTIKTVGHNNSEYQERKRSAIENLKEDVVSLVERKDDATKQLERNNKKITNLQLFRSILGVKIAALVLIPIIGAAAGDKIGKIASSRITEYQTITRTVDYKTGKILDEPTYVFDEIKSPYSATVLSCSPWRSNPAGVGYIRNVTTYEYIEPEDSEEEHRITQKDLEENVREKYSYVETKDILEESDSTEEGQIMITETYQDGTTRPSTKYVIPISIIGSVLGLLTTLILSLTEIFSPKVIQEKLEDFSEEIKEKKLSNKEIKERLQEMLKEAEELKNQYNNVVRKYGSFQDEFIIDEIDTSWLTGKTKKKKKYR